MFLRTTRDIATRDGRLLRITQWPTETALEGFHYLSEFRRHWSTARCVAPQSWLIRAALIEQVEVGATSNGPIEHRTKFDWNSVSPKEAQEILGEVIEHNFADFLPGSIGAAEPSSPKPSPAK